jgi:hypothetical protein
MIDFVRFTLPEQYVQAFENNPDLVGWQYRVNSDGREVTRLTEWPKGKQYLLSVSIHYPEKKPPYVKLQGSLHYCINGKRDNSNQFTIQQVKHTIKQVAANFGFNPNDALLRCFEAGANIITPKNPNEFLRGLIMHRSKPFINQSGRKMNFYHCDHISTVVKCYDKGLQFGTTDYIMRFEIRFKKMQAASKFQIKSLADLTVNSKLIKLAQHINKTFTEILVYDHSIKTDALPIKTKNNLLQGQIYSYWQNIENLNTRKSKLRVFKQLVVSCAGRNSLMLHSELLKVTVNDLFKRIDDNTLFDPLINGTFGCKTPSPENGKNGCETSIPEKTIYTQKYRYKRSNRVKTQNDEKDLTTDQGERSQHTHVLTPDEQLTFVREKIGNHNHNTEGELIQALQSFGQPDNLIKSLLLNNLAVTTPLSDGVPRYYLAGSTPF